MKFSNKFKAFAQLLGLIAAGILGSELLSYITTSVPRETIFTAIQFGLIGGLLYLCYGLLLARLDYQDTMENLNKKVDKK
jgi:hypothetical protein